MIDPPTYDELKILRTLNRVLRALEATQPELYYIGPKAPARRASLVQQLLDSEHAFISMLAKTAVRFYQLMIMTPSYLHHAYEG